ncbi:MAG TPA: carboxypeptidase regulatory-like domain-containing protein, partial [Methylomirabilota bacterium]|nr:carboxypeptidase regulatory-like domain-containing protein [Methylomirabilota bacterium]
NFPVLTSVFNLPEGTVISGTLNSHSNASFTLDFYANTECDPAGHGEGKRYLGFTQVTTDASGNASFNFTPTMGSPTLEASEIVTATATDAAGNTSEFSECSGIASSIGGQIVESDTPLSGASIRLSGFRSGTTSSDAFGNFTFPGLPAFGAYTIVPSKPGYVFTPQSRSFTNLATPGVANFSGAVGTYSISGAVRDPAGNAIAGARVTLRGGTNAIFVTDLRGGYAFTKLPGLTDYTLSVSKPDFAFGPPTNVNNLVANRTVNFTGTPPPRTVTGHVRTSGGQPVPGVTVQASPISLFVPGPVFGSAPTDAQGAYQLANLPSNQRYIVRPSSSQFIFTPSSLLLHLTDTDLTADFTATPGHRISGRVTEGSAPWAGLPVHFTELAADGNHSRGSAITDANGDYQSPLLPEGRDYEVRPASPFVPAPRTPEKLVVLNLPFDVSGQDFSGSRDRFQVSGVVISDAGLAVPGVFVTLTNEVGAQSTNEAVYGAFSSLSPGGLNYTISPSRQGFIFTPSNIVINLTNDLHVEFHGRPVMALTGRIGFLDEIPLVMNADSTGAASENAVVTAEEFIVPCEGVSVECGVFDVEDFLDFGGSSVISSSEYLAVALSPDSRQFAFIERTTFSTFRVGDVIPTTEVRGRLVKWDVDRLSPPVELATGTFLPRVSWSANGARIAFARPANPDDPQGLYVISANGGAGTVHTFPGEPRDPALSPDGNRLAFAAQFNGQYEIYLMNVNGTGLQRLTFNPDDDLEPAWSPDGRTIACASKRGGDFEIVIVDEMTGQELVLTSNSVDDREPAWSPDGERIAFTRNGIIHVTSISGSPAVIALRRGTSPSWGADPTYATPASATLGQDVTVNAGSIDVTFNGVTSPGETTVAAIAPIADATALPEGYFALMGTDTAFEISTTAGVLAPITVCLHVERISDEAFFNGLVILHHENGNLVDITVSHDFATRSICGSANSLSPFRLAVRVDPARPLLQGTVVDTHGAGVSDVLIALGGDTTLATSTDFAGRFTLGNLTHAGNYTVTPIHPAYNFVPPSAFVQNLTGTNALVFTAVPTASPQLRIAYDPQNPGAFTLAWPIDAWPFGLEAADSLTSLKWTPVTVPLAIVGNDFVIKLATAGPARYFRLRRP